MTAYLTWAVTDSNYSAFIIHRSLDNIIWTKLVELPSTVTEYTDTTAALVGQSYYYKIVGVCGSVVCVSPEQYASIAVPFESNYESLIFTSYTSVVVVLIPV